MQPTFFTANPNGRIVALDLGSKRIGVATANVIARLASPLTTLNVTTEIIDDIKQLLARQTAVALVLGLPRGLDGQNTAQTAWAREFGENLRQAVSIPVYWQDEALTSHHSKLELTSKQGHFSKAAVDALAATYILEDFLLTHKK